MSLGPLELEIRRVPGVLACQFTPTDVLVLVEPSADAAAVTATVTGLLGAAAESRRVAVIGGTAAAAAAGAGAFWWLRKHHVAVAGATVATFLAAAGAAAMTGTLSSDNRPHSSLAAPAPSTTLPPGHDTTGPPPTSTPTTTTTTTVPPAVSETPTTAPPTRAQIIRVALPAPLPRSAPGPTTTAVTPPVTRPPTTVPLPPPATTVPPPPTTTPNACDPARVVTSWHFLDNGMPLTDLRRMVSSGDHVTAVFTLANGCQGARVALVSHTMPDPVYVKAHVGEQVIFDSARAMLNDGDHTLGPVRVPDCYFQIDFAVLGAGSTPGYTYSSATGGTNACSPAESPRLARLGENASREHAAREHAAREHGRADGALPAYVDETGETRTH